MKALFLSLLSVVLISNLQAQNADNGFQKLKIGATLAPLTNELQPEPMATNTGGDLFAEDDYVETNWATYTGKAELFGLDYSTFHSFLPMAPPMIGVKAGTIVRIEYELDDRALPEIREVMEAEYGKAKEVMTTRYNPDTNTEEQVIGELQFPSGAKATLNVYLVHPEYNEQTATVVFLAK